MHIFNVVMQDVWPAAITMGLFFILGCIQNFAFIETC